MTYWERRALLKQAYYDRAGKQALDTIGTAYERMIRQMHEDTKRIIGNFQSYFGLTKKEALELLNKPAPKAALDGIRERIEQITDPVLRRRAEAALSADAYRARLSRIDAIEASARVNATQAAEVEQRIGNLHLEKMVKEGYARTMFDVQQYTGLGFGFTGVDKRRINQILRMKWSGKSYSNRVWQNSEVTADTLSKALTEAVLNGKTSRQTFDELMEQAKGSRYAANRLLRTETNYVTNQATADAFEDAGIERYRFMAVLDGRTSDICQRKDGNEYLLSEKEVGKNWPPLHPWCRSTCEPVIDGVSRERMTRWARDPNTGEQTKVPRTMTYREWRASANNPKATSRT